MTGSRRIHKWAAAGLAAFSILLVAGSSGAVNEEWYMMFNCHEDVPNQNGSWGVNQYGYYNTSANNFLFLHCQQPHLDGNSGHNGGTAKVYNRSSVSGVAVELCENDGTGGEDPNNPCDVQIANTVSSGVQTLTFASNTVNTRPYYYWMVTLPHYDSTNGSSNMNSLKFNDN